MKTAVSIPDPIFEAADRLARERRISRSALYAEALERLIAEHRTADAVTAALDAIYTRHDSELDPPLAAAQSQAVRERW